MENENSFLIHALLMGIFITFVYDLLRIFRRVVPHSNLWVSLEDMAFWIYCAAKVFVMMYHESDGTLRWFAVLGAMAGMFLYKKIVSPFFVKYVSLIIGKLFMVLGKIGRIILRPFAVVIRKLQKTGAAAKARSIRRRNQVKWFLKKKLTFLRKMLK